jgi:hypothetical protein
MSEDILEFELDLKNYGVILSKNKMKFMRWHIDTLLKFDDRDALWREDWKKSRLWLEQNHPEILL